MCPQCGYLITYYEKAKRSMGLFTYLGALVVIIIIGLTIGLYVTSADDAEVEGQSFVPDSVSMYAKLDVDALHANMAEGGSLGLPYSLSMDELVGDVSTMTLYGWTEDGSFAVALATDDPQALSAHLEEKMGPTTSTLYDGTTLNMAGTDVGYVAFDDVVLISDLTTLKMSIDTLEGKEPNLFSNQTFSDVMGHMPAYDMVSYSLVPEQTMPVDDESPFSILSKVSATASSIDTEKGETTAVFMMPTASDASQLADVLDMLLSQTASEEEHMQYDISSEDNVVIVWMNLPTDFVISDISEFFQVSVETVTR
jgi:hypothetical protein